MKKGLCINDIQERNKWRRCCRRVVDPGKTEKKNMHFNILYEYLILWLQLPRFHVPFCLSHSFVYYISVRTGIEVRTEVK